MTEDSSTNKNIIGLLSINKDSRRIVHVQYILIMIRTRKLFTHNKEKKKKTNENTYKTKFQDILQTIL